MVSLARRTTPAGFHSALSVRLVGDLDQALGDWELLPGVLAVAVSFHLVLSVRPVELRYVHWDGGYGDRWSDGGRRGWRRQRRRRCWGRCRRRSGRGRRGWRTWSQHCRWPAAHIQSVHGSCPGNAAGIPPPLPAPLAVPPRRPVPSGGGGEPACPARRRQPWEPRPPIPIRSNTT